jgi:hypothetical protein
MLDQRVRKSAFRAACLSVALAVMSCGGGTGNERDSGPNKTYLRVSASDPDGDTLQYQWRVTGGSIENRNASETVWTMPDGPGLHFAYVTVSDGKGGYADQQYAVSTDTLDTDPPVRQAVAYVPPATAPDAEGVALRLRFTAPGPLSFQAGSNDPSVQRDVYLSDVAVEVTQGAAVLFNGQTDANGEVSLPKVARGSTVKIRCGSSQGAALTDCGPNGLDRTVATSDAKVVSLPLTSADLVAKNLRLYGHVQLADGSVCGVRNEFFGASDSATVQVLQSATGPALTPIRRVNRFGDYWIDAAVLASQSVWLRFQCGTLLSDPIEVAPPAGGFVGASQLVPAQTFANRRPQIVRVVANGPEGNVRGRMVVNEPGVASVSRPGFDRFLTYKGTDTARSACMYYRSFGAVKDCGSQGEMQDPISLDDWKRHHRFEPYGAGNTEVAAVYVNERDLNLVRRMRATKISADQIAYYVCNSPGPEGRSQAEVDEVMRIGLAGERQVACVAMEWSVTPGVNRDPVTNIERPFTKFLTFGPTGALIGSINLDGRGEKFMPGACVACHGGSNIGGRFPDRGSPSPYLGARFLPFDTGNYLFSTEAHLSEASQGAAFKQLNDWVVDTDGGPASGTATALLVEGWYDQGTTTQLNKNFVPLRQGNPTHPWDESSDKAQFYREVIGRSCRTCHTALGQTFNWDANPDRFVGTDATILRHVCGGTSDLAQNASMPNALASLDRLLDTTTLTPTGAQDFRDRLTRYLGCSTASPDPVFPR